MPSLSFPDLNVWMPLVVDPHIHRATALVWWESEPGDIAFCRFTQIGLLRLLTTAAAMNGKPLTMREAWRTYDRLLTDGRVSLVAEPEDIEPPFRQHASSRHASPKLWADAYLLAFARRIDAALVTFDQALAAGSPDCVLLKTAGPGPSRK